MKIDVLKEMYDFHEATHWRFFDIQTWHAGVPVEVAKAYLAHQSTDLIEDEFECSTYGCIAGWVVALAKARDARVFDHMPYHASVDQRAANLLNIGPEARQQLFYPDSMFWQTWGAVKYGSEGHYELLKEDAKEGLKALIDGTDSIDNYIGNEED